MGRCLDYAYRMVPPGSPSPTSSRGAFGLHLYTPHGALAAHIAKGCTGRSNVEPRQGWPSPDREFVMVMAGFIPTSRRDDFYMVYGHPFHYDKNKHPDRSRPGLCATSL